MEDKELEELLKLDIPNIEGNKDKVLEACKASKNKYNKRTIKLAYVLSSFIILVSAIVLSVVLINNRTNDAARINKSIDDLEYIDNDEEKMIAIMNIEKDIQNISADKQEKINIDKLSYEENITVNNLKNSVEWKDYINNVDYSLLGSIFNYSLISGIDIHKERFGSEMWVCNNDDFYKELLTIFDLPYVDLKENFSDEIAHAFSDYTNYYSFTIYLRNNELVDIGVYNSGYIRVRVKDTTGDNQQYVIKKSYISLIKLDTSKLYNFMDNTNLSKYNAELSMISLIVSNYSIGMSSTIGPSMKFNLDGASFECSIDCGSFEYYKETKELIVSSNEKVQWAPSYIEGHGTAESTRIDEIKTNGKAYMDVIVKVDEKIVGYIVVEMSRIDETNYSVTVLESVLFKDDNNNLKEVPLEFILKKIDEIKKG